MALPAALEPACSRNALRRLDATEIEILQFRGAFNLPPKAIQDELVDLFFKWVAPILPIINQTTFRARHRDKENPPSILLLQAIFLTTSQISPSLEIFESCDGEKPGRYAKIFFQRAKALYDAGYEQDPVTIVQSLILMSWFFHGPQDGTENGLFYWSKLAITVAQDNDMHRSAALPYLTQLQKRLWRRIWWTLVTRDRAVSAAYGRPVSICLDHSNVEMVNEDDFVEGSEYPPDPKHVQFFLQYVKLCKILDMVACRPIEKRGTRVVRAVELAQCESELSRWLLNIPKELKWQQSRHEFWSAVLHYTYNTIICQLYGMYPLERDSDTKASQIVVSEAASMILSTLESFVLHAQLKFAPPSIVFSLLTLLVTLKNQLSSAIPTLVLQNQRKVNICLEILGLLSERWPIAQSILEASELVFSEKRFTEMLNTATERLKSGEANESSISKAPYKRTLLNWKQARPEMMLPRSRMIVKMALTTRPDDRNLQQLQSPTGLAEAPLVSVNTTQDSEETSGIDSIDRYLAEENGFDSAQGKENLHNSKEMPPGRWDADNCTEGRPLIPLFGTAPWGQELDTSDLYARIATENLEEGLDNGEQMYLPTSLHIEEWGTFLGMTDLL